jgi:hypothetical protein
LSKDAGNSSRTIDPFRAEGDDPMRSILIGCALILFTFTACENRPSSLREKTESPPVPKIVVEREKTDQESPFPPEVKIRLRRDGKDNYSWELSGSDVDQILKVNEKLRKKVGREQVK